MEIKRAISCGVPVLMVYGAEGRGKTTLASKFPKPLALLLERGLPRGVTLDEIPVDSYQGVLDAIRDLIKDPHDYKTFIVDTLDVFEPLLLADVCAKNDWKNIEAPSYGKGWIIADEAWRHFIRGLQLLRSKRGMTVVLVAHSSIERVDDPRTPTFTTYMPKLHKRARHLVLDTCDLVGFLAEDLRTVSDDSGFRERVRAASSNQRFLFVEGTPAFVAKNRFAMPPKIAVPADFQIGELTKFWRPANGNDN
jgi:hypothetical protein